MFYDQTEIKQDARAQTIVVEALIRILSSGKAESFFKFRQDRIIRILQQFGKFLSESILEQRYDQIIKACADGQLNPYTTIYAFLPGWDRIVERKKYFENDKISSVAIQKKLSLILRSADIHGMQYILDLFGSSVCYQQEQWLSFKKENVEFLQSSEFKNFLKFGLASFIIRGHKDLAIKTLSFLTINLNQAEEIKKEATAEGVKFLSKKIEQLQMREIGDISAVDEIGVCLGQLLQFEHENQVESRAITPIGLCGWRIFKDKVTNLKKLEPLELDSIVQAAEEEIAKKMQYVANSQLDIPPGLKVSVGTEIEIVLNGLARTGDITKEEIADFAQTGKVLSRFQSSFLNDYYKELEEKIIRAKGTYSDQVSLLDKLGVGKGKDALHEFSNRPVKDYSILLWELYEIAKLGFIDFDRKFIQHLEKGMHLWLSGEGSGIILDENAHLLQTAMIVSGWSGSALDAGGSAQIVEEVDDRSEKLYHIPKGFIRDAEVDEAVFGGNQPIGVENRALRISSFAHLARTLKNYHRLSITLKAYQNWKGQLREEIEGSKETELLSVIREEIDAISQKIGAETTEGTVPLFLNSLQKLMDKSEDVLSYIEDATFRKLILIWAYFREATCRLFTETQKKLSRYQLKSPLEPYYPRDMTRLGAELFEVFGGTSDTGELLEDSLKSYHQKPEKGSLPEYERGLIIAARSQIEQLLKRKKNGNLSRL